MSDVGPCQRVKSSRLSAYTSKMNRENAGNSNQNVVLEHGPSSGVGDVAVVDAVGSVAVVVC